MLSPCVRAQKLKSSFYKLPDHNCSITRALLQSSTLVRMTNINNAYHLLQAQPPCISLVRACPVKAGYQSNTPHNPLHDAFTPSTGHPPDHHYNLLLHCLAALAKRPPHKDLPRTAHRADTSRSTQDLASLRRFYNIDHTRNHYSSA